MKKLGCLLAVKIKVNHEGTHHVWIISADYFLRGFQLHEDTLPPNEKLFSFRFQRLEYVRPLILRAIRTVTGPT